MTIGVLIIMDNCERLAIVLYMMWQTKIIVI